MTPALRIFRKDVRHLWPRIVLVVVIEVLARLAESALSPGTAGAQGLGGIGSLAEWYLIVSAIHEESLVGDRQYWLTRPFSWKSLSAAKLLFFLAFIHLPVLAADMSALMLRGQSPMAHLPGLLMAQFFTLVGVLGAAAIASVSASLVQFVGISLAALAGFFVILEAVGMEVGGDVFWGGVDWLHTTAMDAFPIPGAAVILAVQYAARKTHLSRCIFAAGVLATVPMMWMPGWHAAFALQRQLGPRLAAVPAVRIGFDPRRALEPGPLPLMSYGRSEPPSAVQMPVLITGIPPGMALYSDRIAADGVTRDGRAWTSGWDSLNRLARVTGTTTWPREERLLAGDGAHWLYVNVAPSYWDAHGNPAGTLGATAALTLLSAEEITPLATGGQPTRVPQGGLCWVMGTKNLNIVCSWPAPTPGYAAIRIRTDGLPHGIEHPLLSLDLAGQNLSYGPCSPSGGLWQVVSTSVGMSDEPSEIDLVTRRVVAHFERGIDIHGIEGGPLP